MKKYLITACLLFGLSVSAQESKVHLEEDVVVKQGSTPEVTVDVKVQESIVSETTTEAETLLEGDTQEKIVISEETTDVPDYGKMLNMTIVHTGAYKPYKLGMPIESFFAGLLGSTIGDYVVQQYYQPADDLTRNCFILISEKLQKKVKKCIQLEPTVTFREKELYEVLGG